MKQRLESSLPLRVTSPEAAQLLRQVQNVQMLRHFMTVSGSTVNALAQEFSLSEVKAYRTVKTFQQLGLLHVERQQTRAGRAVRWYKCDHTQFFLPAELVSLEDYLHDSFQPYEGQIKAKLAQTLLGGSHPVGGLLVGAIGEGVQLIPATPAGEPWLPTQPGSPAIHFGLGPLYLDYPQAKALQNELESVFERYRQIQGAGKYVLQIILTPFEG